MSSRTLQGTYEWMGDSTVQELIYGRTYYPTAAWRHDAIAIRDGEFSSTFAEHTDRIERLGRSIQSALGSSSERYAVLSLNTHEFLEAWQSAMLGAAVITPLNYRLAAAELAGILADSGARLVFVDAELRELWSEVAQIGGFGSPTVVGIRWHDDGVTDFEQFLSASQPGPLDEPDESDLMALMYTGGTTGRPKGVMISHKAAVLNMFHQLPIHRPGAHTVYLHQSPIFHGAAMWGLMGPTAGGGQQCVLPRFTPELVLETVEKFGVTESQMGPTMVGMLLDACGDDVTKLASLQQLVYGSAPMPQGTVDRLVRDLPNVKLLHGYGMTESTSVVSFLRWEELLADRSLIASVGRVAPGVTATIQDTNGVILPPGQHGEICVRGGNLTDGYWQMPQETAEVFRDGWYRTGDMGRMDERGYMWVVDRIKDMIITGGENVYSAEVENAISTHPAVRQVAVIGVPSERWGEQVHAVIVTHTDGELAEADIEHHVRAQIAGYKVPKSWTLQTEDLPTSGAMKILKKDLRERFIAGTSAN
ncbi:MAG: class I adenylate-forming enzyme family protein [Cumulibacter sp.]